MVILGGGFAGLYAYLHLHKRFHRRREVAVTLISEKDYFLFVPLIHEVATGNLLPSSVRQSLRVLPHCCLAALIRGAVTAIDLDSRTVTLRYPFSQEGKDESETIDYDYLIAALGSEVNFAGVKGAAEHAVTLKNLEDAWALKNRIVENFERAARSKERREKEQLLRFVIVGGGPTGVELAGEIADVVRQEIKQAFPALKDSCAVILIHGGPRLLAEVEEWFHARAVAVLGRLGVTLLLNERVIEISPEGVRTAERFIETATVIWTAGVKAKELQMAAVRPVAYDPRRQRIKVNDFLQIPTYPSAFVAGDMAWVCDKEHGIPYPMRAQFAVREGVTAAENIYRLVHKKPLKEFSWRDQGVIISLGSGRALAKLFGLRLSGPFAWWLYRTAYLLKLIGWRAKLRAALEWTLNLFTPRDITRL